MSARARSWPVGLLVTLAVLSGCTAPGGASGTSSGTPSSSVAATPVQPSIGATPLVGTKKVKGVELPNTLGEWTQQRILKGPSGQWTRVYLKPDDSSSVMVTLSPVPLTQAALDAVLTGQQSNGPATCGTVAGGGASCYIPMADGSVSVSAKLPVDQVATLTQQLYDALP